jgi:hypothetical protein
MTDKKVKIIKFHSAQIENNEDEINIKIQDLNNIIDLYTINRDGLDNPDYKSVKRNNVDTEISIKDLQAMEIDENKLEEESNFLLNYNNDLIIARLSESLANKKKIASNDKYADNDIFYKVDLKISKNDINQDLNPMFNNYLNNFENGNLKEEDLIDVNKSIKFNDLENTFIDFNNENNVNTFDLKSIISKEKMNPIDKEWSNNSNPPSNKKNISKIPSYKLNEKAKKESNANHKIKNFINLNNHSINSSVNINNSFNRKSSKMNYNSICKNDKLKLAYSSNSDISSNNCSLEKSNHKQLKNSINLKSSMEKTQKISINTKPSANSNIHNRTLNNTSLNASHLSELNKLKLQQNVALISEKIAKLRDYQQKMKEKIIEAEIQKNRILKNKNEEISYMKRNGNDKQRVLKNLQLINERNQKIIERSEHTINNLKIELRNKSMEIHSSQNDNFITKSINFNNNNANNTSLKSSFVFPVWNKFGKDSNNDCCGGAGHSKNLSHSMNSNRASHCNLNKKKKLTKFSLKVKLKFFIIYFLK